MSDTQYLSKQGLEDLKSELHELKTKGRAEMARQIAEAREKGDLSENAEYDAAKEAQGLLELKISKLENTLANAKVVDEKDLDTSKVTVLTNVVVINKKLGKEITYMLVAEKEANLKAGKISVGSPIGKALLGKKIGEVAKVEAPAGVIELEVKKIYI